MLSQELTDLSDQRRAYAVFAHLPHSERGIVFKLDLNFASAAFTSIIRIWSCWQYAQREELHDGSTLPYGSAEAATFELEGQAAPAPAPPAATRT